MLLQPPGDLRWVVAGVSSETPRAGSAQESYTAISAHVKKITTGNYHHLPFANYYRSVRKYAHSGGPETGGLPRREWSKIPSAWQERIQPVSVRIWRELPRWMTGTAQSRGVLRPRHPDSRGPRRSHRPKHHAGPFSASETVP